MEKAKLLCLGKVILFHEDGSNGDEGAFAVTDTVNLSILTFMHCIHIYTYIYIGADIHGRAVKPGGS